MSKEWGKLVKFIHEMDAPALFGRESKLTHDMDLYHDLDWRWTIKRPGGTVKTQPSTETR